MALEASWQKFEPRSGEMEQLNATCQMKTVEDAIG
jgi:hypothetical protein